MAAFGGDGPTRTLFEAVWGSDAEARWYYEDAGSPGSWEDWKKYGGPKPASSGSSSSSSKKSSSSSSGSSSKASDNPGVSEADKRDGWVEGAGNKVTNAKLEDDTKRYGYDTTAATARYTADTTAKTAKATNATNRYEIDTEARTAANELAQEADQFDATLDFKFAELRNARDRLAMEIGTAAANQWYQQQQVRLADQTHSLAMGQLGLDYIKTDTTLRSQPGSWAQLADFEAGARGQQNVPVFLQNLANNVQGRPYGPMGGVPVSGSMAGSQAALGGPTMGGQLAPGVAQSAGMGQPQGGIPGTEGWNAQQVAALSSVKDRLMAGPQKIAPGVWETLPSDSKAFYLGGIARLGASPQSWQEGIARSRPGQGRTTLA